MLRIFPTDNPSLRASLFASQQLSPGPDGAALVALDDGELVGACLLRMDGATLHLLALPLGDEEDMSLADGLLRASFDYALRRGAEIACPESEPLRRLCESLEFLQLMQIHIKLKATISCTGCGGDHCRAD